MSFNTNPGRAEYTASTGQTVFPFVFKIFNTSDIKVYQTPNSQTPNDTADLLVLDTDYTVTINGDAGGDITLISAASNGDAITLLRDLPVTREVEYQTSGDLLAETLNDDQEYQTYMILDGFTTLDNRTLLVPNTDVVDNNLPNSIKGGYLKISSHGSKFEYVDNLISVDEAISVTNIAQMLTINPDVSSQVTVAGYYAIGDGGGGIFNYDSSQSAVNNGGTIIDGWVRQYSEPINIRWFGAKGDGITDDTIAIQKAFDLYVTTYIPEGQYLVTSTLNMNDPSDSSTIRPCVNICGDGFEKSVLLAKDMSTIVLDHNHTVDTSNNFSRTEGVFWRDFAIIGTGTLTADNHGIKIHGTFRSSISNVLIRGVGGNGIHAPYDVSLEAGGGYTGGSDVYGATLEISNVFLHGNGGSGLFADMFSFNVEMHRVYIQDNLVWGAVLSGANCVMQGGSVAYNGRKTGLSDGEGGGLLIGDGVETTPMTWTIENMEFDRNKFHDIDITRGKNLNISNNRFLDSDDNAGEFWATSQIRSAGSQNLFNNNYFRLPSDTNKISKLFEFLAGSSNNVVNGFDLQSGISTGVILATDISTETPGNIVRQNYKDIISLNRPMSNKLVSTANAGALSVTGTSTEIPIVPIASAYYTDAWSGNTFVAPTAGIFKITGYVHVSTFDGTTSNQVAINLRVDRGSGATTEARNINVSFISNTTDNVYVPFDFLIGLHETNSIALQIFSAPRTCSINTDVTYSDINVVML